MTFEEFVEKRLQDKEAWIKEHVSDAPSYIELLTSKEKIEVGELVRRLVEIDKYYQGEPWNLQQILAIIRILT